MFKHIILITLFLMISTNSFGQHKDAADYWANIYISNLEKSATPVLYAACKTKNGKAFVIFGLDGKRGMVFDLRGEEVVNSASIIIKRQTISIDIENTQGGIYTYTLLENYAKDLLKLPFKFVMPDNVKEIFTSIPNSICVDKPPTP